MIEGAFQGASKGGTLPELDLTEFGGAILYRSRRKWMSANELRLKGDLAILKWFWKSQSSYSRETVKFWKCSCYCKCDNIRASTKTIPCKLLKSTVPLKGVSNLSKRSWIVGITTMKFPYIMILYLLILIWWVNGQVEL